MVSAKSLSNRSKSLSKISTSVLQNKYVLYFVFVLAVGNLFHFVFSRDLMSVGMFVAAGLLTSFFSKNMIVIMVVAMVVANIFQFGKGRDGFASKKDLDDEDGFKDEDEDHFKDHEDEDGFRDDDEDKFKGFEDEDGFKGFEEDDGFKNNEEDDGFLAATKSPTTSRPTTSRPTTSRPTTSRPTTSRPTTSRPTTSRPATSGPTTSGPTTSRSLPPSRPTTTSSPTYLNKK